MTQISLAGVAVSFGATTVLSDVTFTIAAGERWGIVGRNGSGKTTLFRLLTGELTPTSGSIAVPARTRMSLLEQHRAFGDAQTVWEAAAGDVSELLALERSLERQAAALAADSSPAAMERYGRDLERFAREGGYEIAARIDAVLHGMGFDPETARTTPLATLSGGERGRLGLARQVVGASDVLLLDEPTNHLDLATTRWLEQYLSECGLTVLLISHDRAFLDATVDHVLHLEAGTAVPYAGGYRHFVRQRLERRLTEQRAYDQQQRVVARERDYIARNIAGQNSRQAKGRRRRLERLPRLSPPPTEEGAMAIRFTSRERGGDRVASAEHATVGVDGRVLVRDFSGTLMRGEVLGFIGPNGSGKTTFLRALFGEHPVEAGELRLGASVSAAWYRQDLSQLDGSLSIYETIHHLRPAWNRGQVQGHLGRFGFSGDETQRSVASLSGGEQARVALAMLMLSGANLLVLDEPTNHLDVESIEALEDAVERYDGTVLLVSHDRELLRALTTRVWVLHAGRITDFAGGFAEWESVSAEREQAAAVQAREEQALRKVHEKQRLSASRTTAAAGDRDRLRAARTALRQAEEKVEALESRVAAVSGALEEPSLYTRAGGVAEASRLGAELEALRKDLDAALEEWARAEQTLEDLETANDAPPRV